MNRGFDQDDGSCECGGHAVARVNRTTQKSFYGCSRFPDCVNTQDRYPRGPVGSLLISGADIEDAYYDAFYDGDGR
jgi:ssDNA-binding Zn-finger/Zn-ribbon topoisomerase 1